MDRPRVGISCCLLGELVRYDGGHKRDDVLVEMSNRVEWVAVCPEVEVGMGTPREPIQLVSHVDGVTSGASRVRLVGVKDGRDWTAQMTEWAKRRVEELRDQGISGFVLKRDSPSCGPSSVAVVHDGGITTRDGRGLFAETLVDVLPELPIEDEARLHDPLVRLRFIEQVLVYRASR